ncbi:DivIVA domain-containing protein [Bifidobacterium tsurumiense]|uniref:DivIVA domain-containing protein n=1 Tax=Bifidobacterium tsurumiense TaxID=356829 RepID=UPI00389B2443
MWLLTPEDVRQAEFHTKTHPFTHRDCYDADEVDDFLEQVETTIAVLALKAACKELQLEKERIA